MSVIFWDLLPGETPIDDISELKVPGITVRRELNVVEGQNIRKALVKYFGREINDELAPFDLVWMKQLHQEMYGDVWDWAGRFRFRDTLPECSSPWQHIQDHLTNMFENLTYREQSGVDTSILAAELHHQSVKIHPFQNGNGRWGRVLTNVWLVLRGQRHIHWPDDVSGCVSTEREGYLTALKAADAGDYGPLSELHNRFRWAGS
jgi:fido (protein-threonine AMPylation protein)